ncbi:Amidohydrolase [compost metagenome]
MNSLSFAIVDPHIHQWDPYTTPHRAGLAVRLLGRHPRLLERVVRATQPRATLDTVGLTDHVLAPYRPENYAADCSAYSVEAVVHIEAGWHQHRDFGVVGETRWVAGLPFGADKPRLGAIIGTADPTAACFDQVLAEHRKVSPLFRGIRRMAAHHDDPGVHDWSRRPGLYRDPAFQRGYARLAEHGLSFDAWAYSTQLPDVIQLAKNFPEVPLVIDHLATPVGMFGPVGRFTGRSVGERSDIYARWKDDLAELAQHRHVHGKISGLLMPVLGHAFHRRRELAGVETIAELVSPCIEHAIRVFGPERLMFASNFPMDKVTARLSDIIEANLRVVAPYGMGALKAIFRDNAVRFYGMQG